MSAAKNINITVDTFKNEGVNLETITYRSNYRNPADREPGSIYLGLIGPGQTAKAEVLSLKQADQAFQLSIQAQGRLTSVEEFGNVVVRAKYHVEEKRGRKLLVFTEVPFQVKTTTILECNRAVLEAK